MQHSVATRLFKYGIRCNTVLHPSYCRYRISPRFLALEAMVEYATRPPWQQSVNKQKWIQQQRFRDSPVDGYLKVLVKSIMKTRVWWHLHLRYTTWKVREGIWHENSWRHAETSTYLPHGSEWAGSGPCGGETKYEETSAKNDTTQSHCCCCVVSVQLTHPFL